MSGVVKGVLSGDQLVIMGKGTEARERASMSCGRVTDVHAHPVRARQERMVTLAGVSAPRAVRAPFLPARVRARAPQQTRRLTARFQPRGPRRPCNAQGRRDDAQSRDEPYAWQSREFLRQKCIGQPVTFRVEFTWSSREFASAFIGKGENVGLSAVANGLARVRLPPGCALANAAEFRAAEAAAKDAGRGVWAKGEPPVHHVNDVTRDVQKARALLPFLVRAGRTRAQVEFVISASRMKLLVGKENAVVLFSLAGVRCPRSPETGAAEALAFLRTHLTQRDVEVTIDAVERTGVFTGAMHVASASGSPSLALLLVGAGLGHCLSSVDARPDGRQLRAAEEAARASLKGLWKDYVELSAADEADSAAEGEEELAVVVTDVVGGGTFYVQLRDDPNAARVQEAMTAMASVPPPAAAFTPVVGRLCCCQFSGDDAWYRAYVLSARGATFDVFFVDYGNSETAVPAARLAPLDTALHTVPALAHLAALAYIKVPSLDEEGGIEAAQLLGRLTGGGRALTARVEARAF
jgi:endonuclease YncB( thermonuclease family)